MHTKCAQKKEKRSIAEYVTAVKGMKWLECGYKGFNEETKNAQLLQSKSTQKGLFSAQNIRGRGWRNILIKFQRIKNASHQSRSHVITCNWFPNMVKKKTEVEGLRCLRYDL